MVIFTKKIGAWLISKLREHSLEIIVTILGVVVLVSPFIPAVQKIWWFGDGWSGEATRSIVLTLGGLGAFCGLILATRRLNVSQKQAETAEANLFNDRLSRAIVALTSTESLASRNAALR